MWVNFEVSCWLSYDMCCADDQAEQIWKIPIRVALASVYLSFECNHQLHYWIQTPGQGSFTCCSSVISSMLLRISFIFWDLLAYARLKGPWGFMWVGSSTRKSSTSHHFLRVTGSRHHELMNSLSKGWHWISGVELLALHLHSLNTNLRSLMEKQLNMLNTITEPTCCMIFFFYCLSLTNT